MRFYKTHLGFCKELRVEFWSHPLLTRGFTNQRNNSPNDLTNCVVLSSSWKVVHDSLHVHKNESTLFVSICCGFSVTLHWYYHRVEHCINCLLTFICTVQSSFYARAVAGRKDSFVFDIKNFNIIIT